MSKCHHCGYGDESNWHECPSCGQYAAPPAGNPYAAPAAAAPPPGVYYGYAPPDLLPTSGKAIASLVIGILSIVLYFLGFILGPLAIGFWVSARNQFRLNTHKGQGLAVAGLVTGIIGSLIGLLMVVIIIFAIFVASQNQGHAPK